MLDTENKFVKLKSTISTLYQAIQHAEKLDFVFDDPTGSTPRVFLTLIIFA